MLKSKVDITYLVTLNTLGGELVLVAGGAVDVVLLGDEALGPDGVVAHAAHEALLMPLPGLVLHLLHPSPEHLPARVTPGSELLVVAVTAIDSVRTNCHILFTFKHKQRTDLSALLPNCLSTRLEPHLVHRKQASCQCFSL